MIIDRNRHYFLGIFLTDYIFIQSSFDHMRCRQMLNIKNLFSLCSFFLFFGFLLFELLTFRNILILWRLCHIKHIHIRHSHIRKSSHGVKGLLHTIITNTDSLWQTHHFAGLTLRSSAYVAYIFVFIIFIFIVVLFCHTVHSCPFYCSTAQSALHFLTHSLHYAKISAVCSHS